MKSEFRKRLESFLWRLGMILAVTALDFVATNIGLFDLPPSVVTVVGLLAGEGSKHLNKKYQLKKQSIQ